MWLAGSDGFEPVFFIAGIILGAVSLLITLLSVRAIKDIPVAKAYEQYLNEVASGE